MRCHAHGCNVTCMLCIVVGLASFLQSSCPAAGALTKLQISLNSNSSRGIIRDITRYGRFSEKNMFFDYMAFWRVWYGANYSHGVWE